MVLQQSQTSWDSLGPIQIQKLQQNAELLKLPRTLGNLRFSIHLRGPIVFKLCFPTITSFTVAKIKIVQNYRKATCYSLNFPVADLEDSFQQSYYKSIFQESRLISFPLPMTVEVKKNGPFLKYMKKKDFYAQSLQNLCQSRKTVKPDLFKKKTIFKQISEFIQEDGCIAGSNKSRSED